MGKNRVFDHREKGRKEEGPSLSKIRGGRHVPRPARTREREEGERKDPRKGFLLLAFNGSKGGEKRKEEICPC